MWSGFTSAASKEKKVEVEGSESDEEGNATSVIRPRLL